MSTDKFKELDYYGLAYFWNKIKNEFALKSEVKITGSNGITVTMPTEDSGDSVVVSYDNNDSVVNHISDNDIHVTPSDKTNWTNKQDALSTAQLNACNSGIISTKVSGYDTHVANSDVHVTPTDKANWTDKYTKAEVDTSLSNKANSSDLTTHTSNTDVHVTTSDKTTWNAKQDALTDTQLSACNSGITSDKVAQYDGYASSKANDSSVVHTSGDETISGNKTFRDVVLGTDNFTIQSGGNWDEGARITLNKKSENESIIFQTFDSNGNTFAYIMNNNALYPYFNNQNNLGASTTKWKDVYATSFFGGANNIDCSIDSKGSNYIRYSYGLQICWGSVHVGNSGGNSMSFGFTFEKSFAVPPMITVGYAGGNSGEFRGGIEDVGTTTCYGFVWTTADNYVYIIAIGRWK